MRQGALKECPGCWNKWRTASADHPHLCTRCARAFYGPTAQIAKSRPTCGACGRRHGGTESTCQSCADKGAEALELFPE